MPSGRSLMRLLLPFALLLTAGAASALEVVGRCSVRFYGSSTLHDFEGTAPCALLAIEPPDASGRYTARAEVVVAQMKTGNDSRDKRMREMFEAKKFPRILATFASVDPAALRAGQPGALPFRLAIHGVERPVTPSLKGFQEQPGTSARFEASFPLSLKEFGMEGPVVMGFLRVDDRVRVVVSVELTAKNGAAAAPADAAPR